jgi:hypothetical protein
LPELFLPPVPVAWLAQPERLARRERQVAKALAQLSDQGRPMLRG